MIELISNNLSSASDFKELEEAMKALPCPTKPLQPEAPKFATSVTMRNYADELVVYETAVAKYHKDLQVYHARHGDIVGFWEDKLHEESGFSSVIFRIVFEKAFYDSHHAGYEEVRHRFFTLAEFTKQLMSAVC